MTDHYQTLDVGRQAGKADIEAAYHRKRAELLRTHADEATLQAAISRLEEAYATLSDPGARAAYDRSVDERALTVADRGADLILTRPQAAAPLRQTACPHCELPNPIQAEFCQHCGGQVTRPCPNCGQAVMVHAQVCPRCETLMGAYLERRVRAAVSAEARAMEERQVLAKQVERLEAVHTIHRRAGIVFWLIFLAICLFVSFVALVILNSSQL